MFLQLYNSTKHVLVHPKIIYLVHTMGFMIHVSIISGVLKKKKEGNIIISTDENKCWCMCKHY